MDDNRSGFQSARGYSYGTERIERTERTELIHLNDVTVTVTVTVYIYVLRGTNNTPKSMILLHGL
jgi:hypothetical protein